MQLIGFGTVENLQQRVLRSEPEGEGFAKRCRLAQDFRRIAVA